MKPSPSALETSYTATAPMSTQMGSGNERAAPSLHAVIMAGGAGTRFWPMSRRHLPKQFLPLAGGKSLLKETFERLEPLVGVSRLWVVAADGHLGRVRAELPDVPPGNLLGEPAARSTAPCIGLAAQQILGRDPEAALLVCPSDHVVRPPEAFRRTALAGLEVLESLQGSDEPWTVTFGIVPRYPATGFGYIERGDAIPGSGQAFRVIRFREKPPLEAAREYLASGRFYWSSGIFLWRARDVLRLIEKHMPDLARGLHGIREAARASSLEAALKEGFPSLRSVSIDHGVLERARHIAVLAADFEWDDVGSWRAVERYGAKDGAGNSVLGRHVGLDTHGCVVVGGRRLIATIGVENLVVVETDDAVLVCSRDETERVKDIVDRLRSDGLVELI
ncbi:MAG: mannose-1-phosphate guanylyltransferase [Planctomycetes bacterium]|nr:mannose-1-phosphate guanylyltransferase [Planctomycetota bacterium]